MKKAVCVIFVVMGLLLVFSGCSDPKAPIQQSSIGSSILPPSSSEAALSKENAPEESDGNIAIDIDLTKLSSTMIFSEIYNIMMNPTDYLGKTIRMEGTFKVYPIPELERNCYVVVVPDATACCEQGFEFQWEGEHRYPEDYPAELSEIQITGVLDSYIAEDYPYYYLLVDDIIMK